MATIPERFIWATKMLEIKPDFNLLEIGCGAGILADCIANKLGRGNILAIDKSLSMIEKAKKRNDHHLKNSKINFQQTDFLKVELRKNHFDRIIAFNVNFFWNSCRAELELIKQALNKNGLLSIFYQAPFEINQQAAEPIEKELIENKFKVIDIQLKKLKPTSAFCITAKPYIIE